MQVCVEDHRPSGVLRFERLRLAGVPRGGVARACLDGKRGLAKRVVGRRAVVEAGRELQGAVLSLVDVLGEEARLEGVCLAVNLPSAGTKGRETRMASRSRLESYLWVLWR